MIEILCVCDLCGEVHMTASCHLFEPKMRILDQEVEQRASLTLPSCLTIIDMDGRDTVITLSKLLEGTEFGPLEAPRSQKLEVKPVMPFWVPCSADTGEFLNTSDRRFCNWMCFIQPANSYKESNVFAFQSQGNVFFRTSRDIENGEQLLVSYSLPYSKKIDYALQKEKVEFGKTADGSCINCPIHCSNIQQVISSASNRKDRNLPKGNLRTRELNITCRRRKPGRPTKRKGFNVYLPVGSTHKNEVQKLPKESIRVPDKKTWECSQCSAIYNDGLEFAHHFQKHFSSENTHKVKATRKRVGSNDSRPPLTENLQTESNSSNTKSSSVDFFDTHNIIPCSVGLVKISDSFAEQITKTNSTHLENASNTQEMCTEENSSENAFILPHGYSETESVVCSTVTEKPSNSYSYCTKDPPNVIEEPGEPVDECRSPACIDSSKSLPTISTATKASKYNLRTKRKKTVLLESEDIEINSSDCYDSACEQNRTSDAELQTDQEESENHAVNKSGCQDLFSDQLENVLPGSDVNVLANNAERIETGDADMQRIRPLDSKASNVLLSKGYKPWVNGILKKYNQTGTKLKNSNDFKCDICGKMFRTKSYLFRHTRKHTGDFTCFKCERAFARRDSLLNHNCKGNQTLQCTSCSRTFCRKRLLEKHMRSHKRPFKCGECNRNFSTKDIMLKHACSKSTKSVQCPVCTKMFANSYLMSKHLPAHTGQFPCPLCTKWFSTPFAAHSHLTICKVVKEINEGGSKQCTDCQKEFTNIREYRTHEYFHSHSFMCEKCRAHFTTVIKLQNHKCTDIQLSCQYCNRIFSGIADLQNHDCAKLSRPYQCLLCKVQFKLLNELRKHECSHEIPILKSNLPKDSSPLMCEHCGNTFANISSLNAHKVIHGEKRFACTVCNKRFHRKDQLENHSLMHMDPTIPCLLCGKLFKTKRNMIVHSKIHTAEKQFSCPVCSKAFHQKGNLTKHIQTHKPVKIYFCDICDKSYTSKDSFTKHQKSHINGKTLSCSVCNKLFSDNSQLKVHQKTRHSNQAYQCTYCGVITLMRNSMTRHLTKKHAEFTSEWRSPGVLNTMCITLDTERTATDNVPDENDSVDPNTRGMTSSEGNSKVDVVDDLLCAEEVVQSSIQDKLEMSHSESTEIHIPPFEMGLSVENESNIQSQVIVSNTIVLNDQQIEDLRKKFQQEKSGTVVLEDGTIIQQQTSTGGADDIILYVIPPDESGEG